MSKSSRLSFSIAINLLTENFKKGTNTVKNSLRSIQMQVLTFAAALGAGGLGLSGMLTRFKDIARETNRVQTALKNVSDGTAGFAGNLRFINDIANKYGLEVNTLTGNFAKFTASATQANMPMAQQKKVFESLSRASTAFGLSADETNGVFLALSQMMGKGKISSEELRKQMGEKLPIAMQAMAKAAGVSMAGLEKLLKQGKLMSSEIIPKFADALNEMIPNVDTDSLEASLNRLSNTFGEIVNASGFQNKYKSLIDGLTSLLQSASKNIQNIIVGIIAAIGFAVMAGLTKVYQGYAATGEKIIANAKVTHAKMQAAVLARVDAEKRLEELKLQHAQATGRKQIALATQIEKQKQLLTARTAQVNAAHENAKAAAAQAAAIKSMGAWGTAWATISGSAKKLMISLKAMWNSFAPAIIFSGLIALGGYLKKLYDKTKSLERITEDYNTDVEKERININILFNKLKSATGETEKYNKAKNEILSKYGEYLKGLSDEIRSLKDVEGAYKAISAAAIQSAKDKAIAQGSDEATNDYLKIYKKNAPLLKKTLEKSFGKEKGTELFDSVVEQLSRAGNIDEKTQSIINSLSGSNQIINDGKAKVGYANDPSFANINYAINNIKEAKQKLDDKTNELLSIFGQPSSISIGDDTTTHTTPTNNEPDDKDLRAAEKRLEALRKLDEEDRKRQIEKQKFDLDMQQKAIDLMDDSFEKRTKQTLLNLEKENLEIEEIQNEFLKKQAEYAKDKYISTHGTDKGFESYYKNQSPGDLQKIMPEGLRPEDIEKQVGELLGAAQAAQAKGLSDIDKEKEAFIRKERLYFASELEQQLDDIRTNYAEKLKLAKGDAELTQQLLDNQQREIEASTLQSINRQLAFEMQYNQKLKELLSDRYFFEADKKKASLEQEIADQTKLFDNLSKQVLNDPNNENLARDLEEARIQLQLLNRELNKTKSEKLKELAANASDTLSSLRNTLSDFGLEFSDNVNEALDGLGKILDGLASIDLTKPMSIITGGLQALGGLAQSIFGILGSADYSEYNKLKEKYDNLLDIWDELIKKKKEYLSTSMTDEVNRAEKEALDLIDKQADAVKKLAEARLNSGKSAGSHSLSYRMWKGSYKFDGMNWNDVAGEISSALGVSFNSMSDMLNMTPEQLQWIKDNYSGLWTVMDSDFRGYLEQLIEYGDQAIEVIELAKEQLTGISFDSLKDSFLNTLADMDSEAKDFADDFSSYLQKAILKAMMEKKYAKRLEDWYNSFAEANKDGDINSDEYRRLKDGWDSIVNNAIDERDKLKDLFGWESSTTSQDSTKGYSVSMDQDTGGAILGRITGIHETILEVKSMVSAISIDTAKAFTQSFTIGDELKKHTGIFYEMQQMQIKSYKKLEGISEGMPVFNSMKTTLDEINKNTKRL